MISIIKFSLMGVLALALTACGSDSDEPSFASTLEPSIYKNGEWNFSSINIEYQTYDSESASWDVNAIETDTAVLTFLDNAIEGTTTILELSHPDETLTIDGETLDGFVVGETLIIKGHIDGSTIALIMTAESGMTASFIGSVYDGDSISTDNGLWTSLDYWYGVSDVSLANTIPGDDSYVDTASYDASVSSTLIPSAIEVTLGSGDSTYVDGEYSGDGSTYMTLLDNDRSYTSIRYDIDLTVSGNTLSGTLELTDVGLLNDLDGYEAGDVFDVTGTIKGAVVYITCTDTNNPDFTWKHIWGNTSITGPAAAQEAPGEVTEIESYYGVTYRTPNSFGGENYVDIELVVTE